MKKIKVVFILNLLVLISSAQETNIEKIGFCTPDDLYVIYIKQNTVEYFNPRHGDPFSRGSVSKKFKKKKWTRIINLIDNINLVLEDSTSEQVNNEALNNNSGIIHIRSSTYCWELVYSGGGEKGYSIRDDNAPKAMIKLFAILKRGKRSMGKRIFDPLYGTSNSHNHQ